jgi:lipid II:glycine glycyltransferase (peptidoglycan interpeptide bridge formation enzyme)
MMFGLFKKKSNNVDKKIIHDLAQCASDFEHGMGNIDKELAEEFMSRALNLYIERTDEEMNFTASDFYLNSFTGAFMHATIDGNMDPYESQAILHALQDFLDKYPTYNTDISTLLINTWHGILDSKGIPRTPRVSY